MMTNNSSITTFKDFVHHHKVCREYDKTYQHGKGTPYQSPLTFVDFTNIIMVDHYTIYHIQLITHHPYHPCQYISMHTGGSGIGQEE